MVLRVSGSQLVKCDRDNPLFNNDATNTANVNGTITRRAPDNMPRDVIGATGLFVLAK